MAVTVKRGDLSKLSEAPSQTEQAKSAHTHRMIREHLESDPSLTKYSPDTYLQGSYKNSTNVRGDSDVDMGSLTTQIFSYDVNWLPNETQFNYGYPHPSLRESIQKKLTGMGPASFSYSSYRADVLASLKLKYGNSSVSDGNKAIKILGNTNRLDADVLPCLQFRQYYEVAGTADYHQGIVFWTNDGNKIVNFPYQHFENLSSKSQRNNGKVKGCIRIFKRIRNEWIDKGEWDSKRSPSFYIESLVWNVPDSKFTGGYDSIVQNVLATLWNDLRGKKNNELDNYSQANQVFRLFHSNFWDASDAFTFVDKLWNEIFE